MKSKLPIQILYLFFLWFAVTTHAIDQPTTHPKISIIIDDLGNDAKTGLEAARLPGPITCAVLPRLRFSVALANQCHYQNKEVILHTPMEALTPHKLGPGGLYEDMDQADLINTLNADLKAVPFVIGINNHEGSLLTEDDEQMAWVMSILKARQLFFIDSVTSHYTVARKIAKKAEVPALARDVFLDDDCSPEAISIQFDKLLRIAKRNGQAIAIGHPYPATLRVLAKKLPQLKVEGYELVPLSQLIYTADSNKSRN